jgi:alpha-tubulin suppressor-like RCC1 family protein
MSKTYSRSRKAAILLALGCLQCGGDAAGKVELDAAVQEEVDGTSRTSDLPLLEAIVLPDILVSDAPGSDLSDSMAPDVLDRSPTDTSDGSAADVFDTQVTDISDMMGVDISDVPFLPQDSDGEGAPDGLLADTEIGDTTVYDGPAFRLLAMAATNGCAVEGDNIWCWGSDLFLGYGIEEWADVEAYDMTKLPLNLSPHVVAESDSLVGVGVGLYQVCGLHEDGGITCWIGALDEQGEVSYHQLGPALPIGAETLSCNVDCCASYQGGSVACWRPKPGTAAAEVDWQEGIGDVVAVSSGNADSKSYACALLSSGEVVCWGYNYAGLLGVETEETIVVDPVTAPLNISADLLSAGSHYTCAASYSGAVRCWGSSGKWVEYEVPLEEGTTIVQLRTGYHRWCAVLSNGQPVCEFGYSAPGAMEWSEKIDALALAGHSGCLLDANGEVACSGWNNKGQLGQAISGCPTKMAKSSFVLPSDTRAFVTGQAHTCAIDKTGLLDCWGYDKEFTYEGKGGPHWDDLAPPLPDEEWKSVDLAGEPSDCSEEEADICATTESGTLYCSAACPAASLGTWSEVVTDYLVSQVGCNYAGPMAILTWGGMILDATAWALDSPDAPLEYVAEGYSTVKCGLSGCCATDTEKGTYCWGPGVPFDQPFSENGEESFPWLKGANVVVGDVHACVLTPDGEVWCWGYNVLCQFGLPGGGILSFTATPTLVPLPAVATAVASGYWHTCVELVDGTVRCWGRTMNDDPDLYWGAGPPTCTPAIVATFEEPLQYLLADYYHTIAVEAGGELWFTGCNTQGVVPGGAPRHSDVPLPIFLPE